MSDITIGVGKDTFSAIRGDLFFPYVGNWTSHLSLADVPDSLPTGAVTLTYHGLSLSGYILRSGLSEGLVTILVVGGAGGLSKEIDSKYYANQISVQLPLQEIIQDAGEQLSSTSTPSVLSATLPSWPRRQDEPGHLLDTLSDITGALWRVLPDGSVFFGQDQFQPALNASGVPLVEGTDFYIRHTAPDGLMQELDPLSTPALFPGQTFQAVSGATDPASAPGALGRVGRVHYEDSGEHFTARVWYLDADQVEDSVVAGLRALIGEELRSTTYYPISSGQVVQQRGDGTLDIQMDDRRLPPLTSVPYLVAVPGAAMTIDAGSRVQVSFSGGDPRYPQAMLYTSGTGSNEVVLTGDQVDCGTLVIAFAGMVTVTGTYTDPFGHVTTLSNSMTLSLKGKPQGSAPIKL